VTQSMRGEVSELRHELRTPINQIVGYCEMLLEDARELDRPMREQPLQEALDAVREALSLIDGALPSNLTTITGERIETLYESLHHPRTRIVEAMSGLLLQETLADPSFISDVCRIRDAAERLLPTDRPRAEPTATYRVPAALGVAPKAALNSSGAKSARILVVDDIEDNRGVLERRLPTG